MNEFQQMGLPEALLKSLAYMKFDTPTPIQAQAIPVALEGRDILGSAQTGTGKTAAFGIPVIAQLLANEGTGALVLTPTRELAVQVADNIRKMLGSQPSMTIATLIGGEPMEKQFRQLRTFPRIVIGTPGRINDHLQRGSVNFKNTHFLVLDETDRMLDMGFGIQIEKIIKQLPRERQTLMFSATMPSHIIKLSNQYLNDPVRIAVGSTVAPATNIQQELIQTTTAEKYNALTGQLDQRTGSVIVFVKTKHGADRLARKLANEDFTAESLHGDLRQNKRERVIRGFREKKHRILVATDVAARGLDIPHIEHVINYDLPQCPEDYIHRIGRTARAGAEGSAVCLLTPEDGAKWKAIHKLMNPSAKGEKEDREDRPQRSPYAKQRKPGGFRKDGFKGRDGGFKGRDRDGFKPRRGDREDRPYNKEKSDAWFENDRPHSDRQDRAYKPRERSERNDRGDRPDFKKRSFNNDRPFNGDRPRRNRDENGGGRSFNRDDRPRDDRSDNRAPRREWNNDRPNRGDRQDRPFGDRPRGERSDNRAPRREWNNDRPRGDRQDRPYNNDRPRRFADDEGRGNRKFTPRADRDGNRPERPARDVDGNRRGDSKPFAKKRFDDRGPKKRFAQDGRKRPQDQGNRPRRAG